MNGLYGSRANRLVTTTIISIIAPLRDSTEKAGDASPVMSYDVFASDDQCRGNGTAREHLLFRSMGSRSTGGHDKETHF